LFFCSSKTDFEILIMSRKGSKQMYLNILREIFKHEYQFKKEFKDRDKKVLILFYVPLMSHMPFNQEAFFFYY